MPLLYQTHKPIVIEINNLTTEMISWFRSIGGKTFTEEHWDYRGNPKTTTFVGYGKGKYCHHRKDGTGGVRLHFNEEDAKIAALFILNFSDFVEHHNIVGAHFE